MNPVKVSIEKIVSGGFGLARLDDRVVLIPYSAPGDILEILPRGGAADRSGESPFYEIRSILEPSPHRIASRCAVFGLCGGCDFDHLEYGYELTVKQTVLLEDLRRIARLQLDGVGQVLHAQSPYGYRNHAQVKIDGKGRPGFFKKKSHRVVPFPREGCLLLDGTLNDLVRRLVRTPQRGGGMRIRTDGMGGLFTRGVDGRDDDPTIRYRVNDLDFCIGIDDFFQVNSLLNHDWVRHVMGCVEPEGGDRILDLFCGSGLIALSLAGSVDAVAGIEANGSAVRNAAHNARLNGLDNAVFIPRDLTEEGVLKEAVPSGAGTLKVVADPPRTGMAKHLVESIAALEPRVVVYVSCNSATFARDIGAFLKCGYTLSKISIIDMFSRTRHIEAVARLVN
jgi:tRNA/tmRNA/rRNA uracil-C5-methylase (TrmA/RlmC/RlmD family)